MPPPGALDGPRLPSLARVPPLLYVYLNGIYHIFCARADSSVFFFSCRRRHWRQARYVQSAVLMISHLNFAISARPWHTRGTSHIPRPCMTSHGSAKIYRAESEKKKAPKDKMYIPGNR